MKDLFKIGVFMIGIASLVIAFVVVLVYFKASEEKESHSFWTSCYPSDGGWAVVVRTSVDLENVEVKKMDMTFGEASEIEGGSEKVFWVKDGGVYEIEAKIDGKKISKAAVCGKFQP